MESNPADWIYKPILNGFNYGRPGPIQGIVWHDMEGYLAGAIATWNTGIAGAHLCIRSNGAIVQTVNLRNTAWHAGTDRNTGRTEYWKTHDANDYTIGIELEGFAADGYTTAQIEAAKHLALFLTREYQIEPAYLPDGTMRGHKKHSDISNQRSDPGPHFPLQDILDYCGAE